MVQNMSAVNELSFRKLGRTDKTGYAWNRKNQVTVLRMIPKLYHEMLIVVIDYVLQKAVLGRWSGRKDKECP